MRTTRTAIVVVTALVAVMLATAPASADPVRWRSFQMPSGNIHCWFQPAGDGYPAYLRCDILSGLEPEPSGDCEGAWVGAYLQRRGRAHWLCAGDTVYMPDNRVLQYGQVWKRRGIRCVSRETGLRCRNTREHGFFLSRAESRRF